MSVELKLSTIAVRQSRNINGYKIYRLSDQEFLINGENCTLKAAIKILCDKDNIEVIPEVSSTSSASATVNLDKIAFVMVEPPARIISNHIVSNEDERLALVKSALKKGLILYFSDVRVKDGKYYASQPWMIDWDSVPNNLDNRVKIASKNKEMEKITDSEKTVSEESKVLDNGTIICPYCNKKMNSLFGRTNHVRGKHPEKIEEYKKNYG
jgi:hypothetical protein